MILILVFSINTEKAYARSLEYLEINIEAEMNRDGSVSIVENRTVKMNGKWEGFYYYILLNQDIEIVDILVSENGVPYIYNPGTEYGEVGTYLIKSDKDRVLIDWSIDAKDEIRTFELSYRVNNLVKVYNDIAEFYYQFIGNEWQEKSKNINIKLFLADNILADDILAWGYGPRAGKVDIEDGLIIWQVDELPARTFLEGRVIIPAHYLSEASIYEYKDRLPEIFEEKEKTILANLLSDIKISSVLYGLIIILSAILIIVIFWRLFNGPFEASFKGKYYRELPSDITPAELGVLLRKGYPNRNDFMATILDLARKGYIIIHEERTIKDKKTLKKFTLKLQDKDKKGLKRHERSILIFLFDRIAKGKELRLEDIEKYARRHSYTFAKFWERWRDGLKKNGEKRGYFNPAGNKTYYFFYILSLVFLFLGAYIITKGNQDLILGSSFIIAGLILISQALLTIDRLNYSNLGRDELVKWKAFRCFLLDFSQMEKREIPSIIIWEHYLVYAISLGITDKVMKQLNFVFPRLEENGVRFASSWLHNTSDIAGIGDMSKALNKSLFYTFAFSGGSGGGFSSGGGSGAGGGGGGGR